MNLRKPYPTDLGDHEWDLSHHLVPEANAGGRPEEDPKREILNGIFYVVRSGCSWRMLPHDLPPWHIVDHDVGPWCQDGTWQLLHDLLRGSGQRRQPSAGIIASPSVKTTDKGGSVGMTHKQVTGRKRHLLVATLGLLLAVVVTAASVQDRDGAKSLLEILRHTCSRWRRIWADQADAGPLVAWVWALRPWRKVHLEIVKRSATAQGFEVLPNRWMVERTLGWFGRSRRLSKDDAYLTCTSEARMRVAMSHVMVRRLARIAPY